LEFGGRVEEIDEGTHGHVKNGRCDAVPVQMLGIFVLFSAGMGVSVNILWAKNLILRNSLSQGDQK